MKYSAIMEKDLKGEWRIEPSRAITVDMTASRHTCQMHTLHIKYIFNMHPTFIDSIHATGFCSWLRGVVPDWVSDKDPHI